MLVLPGVARRLHDVGLGLWVFLLVYSVYPVVLALQTTGMFGGRRELAIFLAGVPFLAFMLALFMVPGSSNPNRFGNASGRAKTC